MGQHCTVTSPGNQYIIITIKNVCRHEKELNGGKQNEEKTGKSSIDGNNDNVLGCRLFWRRSGGNRGF